LRLCGLGVSLLIAFAPIASDRARIALELRLDVSSERGNGYVHNTDAESKIFQLFWKSNGGIICVLKMGVP